MKNLYSTDLEKSLLASLMSIDNCYHHVVDIVKSDDFAISKHRLIFDVVKSLSDAGDPYNCVMVIDQLTRINKLSESGGESYIAQILATSPATLFNVVTYSKRIKGLAQQRKIRQIYEDARLSINDDGVDIEDKINDTISNLVGITESNSKIEDDPESISSLMGGFFDRLEQLKSGKKPPFIPTGFIELDLKAPIENGDLVIVAARPSMGKTTFIMNVAEQIITNQCTFDEDGEVSSRKSGVFFSLEMDKKSVVTRFMSSQSAVNMSKIRNGQNLDEDDWAALMRTATLHRDGFPLMVDDRSSITCQQIRTTLNKLRRQGHDIGVIVIDYIQIMGDVDHANQSSSIAAITASLKAIGKEFGCPVVALSQLNRDLEKRPNKRPVNSDLRSSGAIEQDADMILFIYRDEVYNENSEHRGTAEIIIGKNRQGEIGTVRLGFEGQYSRFTNFTTGYQDEDLNEPAYG